MLRQEANSVISLCFNLCNVHFELLISALPPQGHDITYFKRQYLDKDEIEYLTANQRQPREILTK
jgi:hypothetical protein